MLSADVQKYDREMMLVDLRRLDLTMTIVMKVHMNTCKEQRVEKIDPE